MPKFRVYGKVVGTKYLGTYEAKTKQDAIEQGVKKEGFISLCHHCSKECEDAEVTNITAEKE